MSTEERIKHYRKQLAFKGLTVPKSLEDAKRLLQLTEGLKDINFRKLVDWRLYRTLKTHGIDKEDDIKLIFTHRK